MRVTVSSDTDNTFSLILRQKINADEADITYSVMHSRVNFKFFFRSKEELLAFSRGKGEITEWSVANKEGIDVLKFTNMRYWGSDFYFREPAKNDFGWVYELTYESTVTGYDPRNNK